MFHSIDWHAIQTYMQTLTLEQKVSFVKYSHKWRPTNKKLHQMNLFETENAEYTSCGEVEDNNHPFKCNDPIMRDVQEEILTDLCSSLTKIHTSPSIIRILKIYIQKWMLNKPYTSTIQLHPNIQYHQEITLAIEQQEQIGWDHFIRGRLSKL